MAQFDDIKGRVKEGVGAATDNEEMEREGKVDRATGKVKDTADSASDKVRDALRRD